MPLRPCLDCSALSRGSRCPTHAAAKERARTAGRGTTVQRGYGPEHKRLRAAWAPRVASGQVACGRCGQVIAPGEAWDLGHTDDRTGYRGPEHAARCNRRAAGRVGAQRRATERPWTTTKTPPADPRG